jgi:hypothetical protein
MKLEDNLEIIMIIIIFIRSLFDWSLKESINTSNNNGTLMALFLVFRKH